MNEAGPGWELWRTFLAVVEHGSLSAAARALGLTQPTVGRHVAELEAALHAGPLFTRSPQGLAPTDTALSLEPHAQAMAAAAQALVRTASAPFAAEAGVVRITCSEVVGAEVLPPILAALHAGHPGLVFELAPSNATQDLLRRDADIAVRMTPPRQAALVARRLGNIELGLHAHPDYLARNGAPERMEDLAGHAMIGFDRDPLSARSLAGLPFPLTREMFALRTDSDLSQLAAIRAGFGLGICQLPLARRTPGLTRVLPDFTLWLGVWLVMHEDLRASRRVRLVFDHLAEALADYCREMA